ncbi:hypothetical protein QLX08_007637 [Tetragonisca angustula]|uniref:ATP synthase F0 subunit 8 n=1 Tax=Tetragonisca angustula TaxID=166442 RepID=A0AAW0ZNP5_9HYME
MTLSLYFSVFWIIGIVWTVYYWCSENSCKNRVIFDLNSGNGNNIMSIDSSDVSDDESSNCNKKRLKYEIKTRWPSSISISDVRYGSMELI